jgi:predicted GNAT family acetyltransferase
MSTVTDNRQLSRYEMQVPGGLAFVNYRRTPGIVTLTYAKVPEELQGRGIGAQLVRGVLEQVRAEGDKVVPLCGFVATYMRRHKEVQDLLA